MKLVINKCWGGFSISPEAIKFIADKQGKPCYFFNHECMKDDYTPIKLEDIKPRSWNIFAFDVPNPNEIPNGEWDKHYHEDRPENRSDPYLVQAVEELGAKANGVCAELVVVEIPDGTDYYIDDYDGMESVHENHRSWS